jgi:prepilin-type N-terminal cleavage/methylation domain-containing protein
MMNQPRFTASGIPQRRLATRRAFTMIEILTVIAIIALLATITVVGMRSVGGNAKTKQARTVLEVMRSALAQAVPIDDPKIGDRFYGNVLPVRYGLAADSPPGGLSAAGIDHYMNVVQTDPPATLPTIRTAEILSYLGSNQGTKKQIESLPPNLRRTVYFNATQRKFEKDGRPVAGNVVVTLVVPIDPWGMPLEFVYGGVRFAQGESMVAVQSLGGLCEMSSAGSKQYWRGPRTPLPSLTAQPAPPSYSAPSGYTARAEAALQSPDKGSFWVSAGEDGKFETHDDNLYSFEGN